MAIREVPAKTKQLIEQSLKRIHLDSEHHLKAKDRFAIYKSFGLSRLLRPGYSKHGPSFNSQEYLEFLKNELKQLQVADYALGWLAILTARHVLPVWEQSWDSEDSADGILAPEEILMVAERVLRNTYDIEEAYGKLCNDFNVPVELSTTFEGSCAYRAAFFALEMILISDANYFPNIYVADDMALDTTSDFALTAMQAYSSTDRNEPGEWSISLEPNSSTLPIEFDKQKRLEFWEWWLTEAIPQAWEIATTNSANH